jgi:hypothetical protein
MLHRAPTVIISRGSKSGPGVLRLPVSNCKILDCRRIQCDEIWTFCRMKQARIPRFTDRTVRGRFVAIEPDTRPITAYRVGKVGKRTRETAVAFRADLSSGTIPLSRRLAITFGWRFFRQARTSASILSRASPSRRCCSQSVSTGSGYPISGFLVLDGRNGIVKGRIVTRSGEAGTSRVVESL